MENDDAVVVDYEPALRAGEPRLLGFRLPRLRHHRFRAAIHVAWWGTAGLLSTTVSRLDTTNTDHVMLYFIFLMIGVILLLLAVAAADLPWAERAAALLEGRLRAMLAID